VVLENGVDTVRYKRFMLPDLTKKLVRVGCVANLRPVKNIDGLMRAAKSALERFPQLVFEVAGDGEQRAELERLHTELGLVERFVLRGSVSDVPNFLRSVDVAVLPSHSEGMSNALLEYMAAGRAVVATAVGANPTLIDDGTLNFIGLDPADAAAKDDSVTSALAIPVNRPVELRLRSKDVIHNFWVPQLRFKQDLVPGMEIKVHFTANKVGKYELACAELCGQLHFKMKSYMLVLPEDELTALQALPQEQFQARIVELLNKYPLPTN